MKIFAFVNGPFDSDMVWCVAIDETGRVLAQHACSAAGYGPHDMGVTSKWKHEFYDAAHPGGWTIEWVDDPTKHAECWAAIERGNAKAKEM